MPLSSFDLGGKASRNYNGSRGEIALSREGYSKMGKNRKIGPSAIWSYEIIMMFCDLCLREIAIGNRPNTHFNKAGWTNLVKNFKEYTGREYDRLQLKNKWDQLKKDWKLWNDLKKGASGFAWNSKRKTIDGSDEWWEGKFEAKKFRYNGIDPEMEAKLDKMFMTDENAWAPNSDSLPPVVTDENHEDFEDCESARSLSGDTKMVNELKRSCGSLKRTFQPSFNGKGNICKSLCLRSGMSGTASEPQMFQEQMLQTQIQQLVDVAALRSKATTELNKSFAITEAVRVLDSIEGFEEDTELYGFCIDLLMEKDKREMFMALKASKRDWYLRREFEKKKNNNAC